MKTAIELMEMAQKMNKEILEAGFNDKEVMQICELIHRANSIIVFFAPIDTQKGNPAIQ
jgi:hypothetical protein